jgi:hypothetical protein
MTSSFDEPLETDRDKSLSEKDMERINRLL